ncbi:serine/threonine-protein kinase [Tahibacter harae]|uniref:non-specific serine/threonine protein kinase n=1 Tax=Tahibacter harae TaxID=2963937 RepID=A0ABT1QPN6_9GAMM|nr:serine/threonine-protein kinase [Tahibacter harae]MCQ4164246.1 protein kinase [Tahibacter harae]
MKTQLGHYDIVAELGRGGMGVVYKGYESSLNRYVAIKVLAESLAHDESVKERFLREARSMASLNDPHIIQIYFIGEHEGQTFFVMEFVEGESLGSLLKRDGKLRPEQAARVILQTAMGLASAHDKGVVHRDIKPGNLMVTSRGAIKIADFGIALVTQDFSKKLTSTGEFVGTPGYLSPEVCLGKPVDSRSDIFSLGIVLFEMLTGRMPFTDESPLGLMLEVVRAEIPDVRQLNSDVDAELSRILSRMIAKDPNDRYNNCHELVEDLSRHPALAGAPTIGLKPMVSTAAATVIGMKTPASAQRPLPQTAPTPRPGGFQAGTAAAPMPTPPPRQPAAAPATRPSMVKQPPARRSSALPWAIAAVAVLALAGGGVFAFRDQIPFLKSTPATLAATTTTTQPAATTAPATTAPATTTATQPAALPAASTPTTPSALPAANGDATATPPVTDPNAATASTAAATAPSTTEPAATASALPAGSSADAPVQTVASVEPSAGDTNAPEPRASRVDALRDLAAARASEDASQAPRIAHSDEPSGPRIARAAPPESPAAPAEPKVPTIAVLVGGDAVIAGPARQEVTRALQRSGFNVIDGGRTRDDSDGDIGRLAGKANAAVVVYVRPVGSQVLTYYGQASTLYTAQISLRAFALKGRRSLGAGWTEQVNFTSLNASEQAREVIEPMADDLAQALGEFRARGGRG